MKKNIAYCLTVILLTISGCYHDEADTQVERPTPPPIPPRHFKAFQAINFTDSELEQIATLVELVPEFLKTGFNDKYQKWTEFCASPEVGFHTFVSGYAYGEEYADLLKYCKPFDKAVWPLLFEHVVNKNRLISNLLRELTADGIPGFLLETVQSLQEPGMDYPDTHSVRVVFCKKLLVDEYDNIIKAIQAISNP